jgi:spermidine/putrescine transport system permease protein
MPDDLYPKSRPGAAAWFLFLPLTGWLLALVVAPTILLIIYSFCDNDELPAFSFTLDNYREIFESDLLPIFQHMFIAAVAGAIIAVTFILLARRHFSIAAVRWGLLLGGCGYLSYAVHTLPMGTGTYLKIFWKSTELAGITALLCLIAGYPVAYFLGRCSLHWRRRLLLLVMIPFWTSFVIRTYAWVMILNEHGWLNLTLRSLRLQMLIPQSGEVLYTPTAVVIGLVYAYLPFMILPIFGSVEKLDNSLIEASLDLGAGSLRTLTNVIFPLTAPGVVAGILLVFVPAIAMFAVTDVMSGNKLQLLGSKIEELFNGTSANPPLGAAVGVVLMLSFGLVALATGVRSPRENVDSRVHRSGIYG